LPNQRFHAKSQLPRAQHVRNWFCCEAADTATSNSPAQSSSALRFALTLDYQDSRCRCRIIVERPDLLTGAANLLTGADLPREWLQVVDGLASEATIDAIITLVNQVVRWDRYGVR